MQPVWNGSLTTSWEYRHLVACYDKRCSPVLVRRAHLEDKGGINGPRKARGRHATSCGRQFSYCWPATCFATPVLWCRRSPDRRRIPPVRTDFGRESGDL